MNLILMMDEAAEETIRQEVSPGVFKDLCTVSKLSFMPFEALVATAVELKPDESFIDLLDRYHRVGKDTPSGDWAAQTPLTIECDTLKIYTPNIKLQQEYLQSLFKSD